MNRFQDLVFSYEVDDDIILKCIQKIRVNMSTGFKWLREGISADLSAHNKNFWFPHRTRGNARSEYFTSLEMKMQTFLHTTPCRLEHNYRPFEGVYSFYLQDLRRWCWQAAPKRRQLCVYTTSYARKLET